MYSTDPTDPTDDEVMTSNGAIEAVQRLSKDLKQAATTLSPSEVRYLVGLYYELQEQRIRAAAQTRQSIQAAEPNALISWMKDNYATLENDIKRTMDSYTAARIEGRWLKSIIGIGPVLSAGLLAHIDIERAPSPAHVWSFAGVNPLVRWFGPGEPEKIVKGIVGPKTPLILDDVLPVAVATNRSPSGLWKLAQVSALRGTKAKPDAPLPEHVSQAALISALSRRPWNAKLKVLVWKAGQSFVKSSNNPNSFYGPLYKERKAYELRQNNMVAIPLVGSEGDDALPVVTRYTVANPRMQSAYAALAREALERKKFREGTDAKAWYEQGMLSPGHIQQRCERWTSKLLLSHLWYVMYETRYGAVPPRPFVIEHMGHVDYIPTPNWPMSKP